MSKPEDPGNTFLSHEEWMKTTPNPGKRQKTLGDYINSGVREQMAQSTQAILNELYNAPGAGSGLLNVMPIVDHSARDDAIDALTGAAGYFNMPPTPESQANHAQIVAMARRMNRRVNDRLLQSRYTHEGMRAELGRRRSEELMPLIHRTGMFITSSAEYNDNAALMPTYQGRPMADYSEEEWRWVLAQWQVTPPDAGPFGLLYQRRLRIQERCRLLGIPFERVVEPGHEDHFNGRPIVEYSDGAFNHLLNHLDDLR